MNRVDGTAARQLDLIGDDMARGTGPRRVDRVHPRLRLLRKDVYAELARRRRRAQIAARHALDRS